MSVVFKTTLAAAATALSMLACGAAVAESCVIKHGSATGITRDFAEYEALLIIRQVTGNWPIESDRIGPAIYKCKEETIGWTCRATAKVCKG